MSAGSWYLLFSVLLFGAGIWELFDTVFERDYVAAVAIFVLSATYFFRYLAEARKERPP